MRLFGERTAEHDGDLRLSREEHRILREYEKIAFADTSDGEIKVSDKLRALEHYRALTGKLHGAEEKELSLVVNYDYGD